MNFELLSKESFQNFEVFKIDLYIWNAILDVYEFEIKESKSEKYFRGNPIY